MQCPKLINVRNAPSNWAIDSRYVMIGRPSIWGNPWGIEPAHYIDWDHVVDSRNEAIANFRKYITEGDGKYLLDKLGELTDKILICFCYPKRCHGEVLIELWKQRFTKDN